MSTCSMPEAPLKLQEQISCINICNPEAQVCLWSENRENNLWQGNQGGQMPGQKWRKHLVIYKRVDKKILLSV